MKTVTRWDYNLYPDEEPPDFDGADVSEEDRAEYLERLCRQTDWGVFPYREYLDALADWKDVFDKYPVLDSPAYHAFRTFFGWNQLERVDNPARERSSQVSDFLEGREAEVIAV